MLPVATSFDAHNDFIDPDTRRFVAIEYLLAADNAQSTRQPEHVVDIINNSWSHRLSHEELTANRWGLYTETDNTTITVLLNDLPVYKALLDSGDSSKNDINLAFLASTLMMGKELSLILCRYGYCHCR